MTGAISHAEAHKAWAEAQLVAFRAMSPRQRISAVKSGALEHWTETTRAAALDLLGAEEIKPDLSAGGQIHGFEPALCPLPPLATTSPRFDRLLMATLGGWAVLMIAVTVQAYWPF